MDTQSVLELPDLLRQRRLRHMQRLGGTREITVFRDGKEVADVTEQHATPRLNYWSDL
ncbi:protein of unknown function [Pararobbsia alpina]